MPEMELLLDFLSPCGNYRLTFDDDGKVAYAYLKRGDSIIGDVWLYNRCPTPLEPEWKDRHKAPFANPEEYVSKQARVTKRVTSRNVRVNWEYEGDEPVAYVYVFRDLYGVVGPNDKPGYARHARKDSRLARVMVIKK